MTNAIVTEWNTAVRPNTLNQRKGPTEINISESSLTQFGCVINAHVAAVDLPFIETLKKYKNN